MMPDILIRGVEAPTSCEDCKKFFLKEYDFPCYRARCSIGGTVPPYPLRFEKRGDDCPILELPEHGDLIDRAALMEEHAKAESGRYGNLFVAGDNRFIHRFLDAPVVIPADKEKAAPAATGTARK